MRLYEVVSLLLCSWKAEVCINKIYNAGAFKRNNRLEARGTSHSKTNTATFALKAFYGLVCQSHSYKVSGCRERKMKSRLEPPNVTRTRHCQACRDTSTIGPALHCSAHIIPGTSGAKPPAGPTGNGGAPRLKTWPLEVVGCRGLQYTITIKLCVLQNKMFSINTHI